MLCKKNVGIQRIQTERYGFFYSFPIRKVIYERRNFIQNKQVGKYGQTAMNTEKD
jgi:hypothetical protein